MSPAKPPPTHRFEESALSAGTALPGDSARGTGVGVTACPLCRGPGKPLHLALTDRLHDTPGRWGLVECIAADCGLVWIAPTPDTDTLAMAYAHYFTHAAAPATSMLRRWYEAARRAYLARRYGYRTEVSAIFPALLGAVLASIPHRRVAFDASVMWLEAVPDGRVLDIGCGNGTLLAHLAELGWKVQGLETDPAAAAIARHRGLSVVTDSLETASLPAGTFDAVVMSHVIEHVDAPLTVLERCMTLLKPGGRLVLLTPNIRSFGHRRFGRDWLHLDPPRHLHLFSTTSLRRLAEGAGFDIDKVCTVLRDADWTLGGSQHIRDAGHYTVGTLPWRTRWFGMALMMREWMHMQSDATAGEEVLLIARRPR